MGADIYLNSLDESHKRQHQPLFDQMVAKRNTFCVRTNFNPHGTAWPASPEWKRQQKQYFKLQSYVEEAYDILMESPGYFRDSYNETSLFWMLGLSWWEIGDTMLDEERNLPIEHARELLATMEGFKPDFDALFDAWVKKKRKGQKKGVDGALRDEDPWKFDEKDNGVEDWRKMFRTKLDRFIDLLKRSIEMNEPLHWSV